jgi:PAT family beta-lactamase induction signal transducer AmpG
MLKRFSIPIFICFFLGISSGLPLAAAGGTLQAWMKNQQLDLKTIGFFSLIGIPYSYKFLWAPFVDRYSLPTLGRRKSWMYLSQALLVILFLFIASCSPANDLYLISLLAFATSFISATQDIVLDAYRRDILSDEELGLGASVFVAGYRVGLLLAGAVALWATQFFTWPQIYIGIASIMVIGFATTLISKEPAIEHVPPRTLLSSVVEPLKQFLQRTHCFEILLFILLYKIGDTFAAAMSSIFILDLGFSNAELGTVGKTYGLLAAIGGGLIGGSAIPKLGLKRALLSFGIIQALGILAFSILAYAGKNHLVLIGSVIIENLTSGMGTAAFLAFLGLLCDRRFSATQYALLSSVSSMPRTMFSFGTGVLAEAVGWEWYFGICALTALPGLLLMSRYNRWHVTATAHHKG